MHIIQLPPSSTDRQSVQNVLKWIIQTCHSPNSRQKPFEISKVLAQEIGTRRAFELFGMGHQARLLGEAIYHHMSVTQLHKDVIETLWNAEGCSAGSVYVQWLAANIAKNTCASNADWHHEIKDYMGLPGNEALKALLMNPSSISPPRKET